jgi:hypothetical protein
LDVSVLRAAAKVLIKIGRAIMEMTRNKSLRWLILLVLAQSILWFTPAISADAPEENELEIIDWGKAKKQMKMLSQMGYHPFLMPLIMENRDTIGLSNAQVKVFRDWRNKYRVPLIHTMNRIIQERVAFNRISLNPRTSEEVLRAKQEEIFKLHKKVLEYQLSCRRNILDTFTDEQWEEFQFVLTENGYDLDS